MRRECINREWMASYFGSTISHRVGEGGESDGEVRDGCLIEKFGIGGMKCLSSSRERSRVEKMIARSEGWWSDEVERLIDARKVASGKLQGARMRREEEGILKQL